MAKLWSLCLAASTLLPVEAVRVTGADPLSAELLVVQLNAFEDDLAMNTQTRNMVVNEPAVNQALLPVHKTWPDVLAALSDAQGSGSGIGGFHRSSVNTWLKTNYKAVRFSFDPSMFLRLAECAFEPDSKVCKTRAAYLTCARAEHLPCSYGADETGPTIALWDLDADLREDIPTPKTLWVRDDHAGSSKEWVEYHGVYGKLVKTLWGRLLDELPREVAVQVYAEITKVDTRLSWSFRAPYLLKLVTNDRSQQGCGGDLKETPFCLNMKERYFPGDLNRAPSLVLLEEFKRSMAKTEVLPSSGGGQVSFVTAMQELGYGCMWYEDETLVCWSKADFADPHFPKISLEEKKAQLRMFRNEQDCTSGEGGAKTCNLRFDELQTVCPKRVDFPCPEADPQLVHFAESASHQAAMLRLTHSSGRSVVVAAAHLQTTSTDKTGEMRSYELQQLRAALQDFAETGDLFILGGDFNINLAPAKKRAPYEHHVFLGNFEDSLVLREMHQPSFNTGFTSHRYGNVTGNVTGVAFEVKGQVLLDVMGAKNQGGCVTSKSSGRAMMIDYLFVDARFRAQYAGACMEARPKLEPDSIPDVNNEHPVELSDHFALTALLSLA